MTLMVFCAPSHHSIALLPVLDPVHRLRELCPGVFLYGHPETLPRRLRLDPESHTDSAGLHRGAAQGDLCQKQHWCEQDDCLEAARLWQIPLSIGNSTQDGAVVNKREDDSSSECFMVIVTRRSTQLLSWYRVSLPFQEFENVYRKN